MNTERPDSASPKTAAQIDAANRVRAGVASWLDANSHELCVAFSGGVDSSVLLHALASVLIERGELRRLSALHVHHGLLPNADAWCEHCKQVTVALGVGFHAYRAYVDRNDPRGIEAAARAARYALFKTHLERHPRQRLLIAQHARDQAESVLLQLLRGAGPAGLSGMADETVEWSRPLLNVAKADVDAYQIVHQVSHITDESNADTHYARNRLRARVWPTLVENFPAAEATLSRSARWQQEASDLADALGEVDLAACATAWGISISMWLPWSSARRRNLLRYWLTRLALPAQSAARLCEWERQIESSHTDNALCLSHQSFPGSIRRYRDDLCYVPALEAPATDWQHEWRGETHLICPHGELFVHTAETSEHDTKRDTYSLQAPISLGRRVLFRLWRKTDFFEFSPNEKTGSLKNLFYQHGVPVWLRASWPVLEIDGQIASVVGLGVSAPFRVKREDEKSPPTRPTNAAHVWFRWRPRGAPLTATFDCGPISIESGRQLT